MQRQSFLAGSGAALLAGGTPVMARAQSTPQLRCLALLSDIGAMPFYAQEAGFFTKAGLNVEVSSVAGGGANIAAVAGGAVEIGADNAGNVVASVIAGIPITIFADSGFYRAQDPTTFLCTGLQSSIKDAKDLVGKKIAIPSIKGIGEVAILAWLAKNGVDQNAVSFVESSYSVMASYLAAGRIDAALISEPQLTVARATVKPLAAPFDAISPQISLSSFIAKPDWIAKNKDVAHRFKAVIEATAKWANANPLQTRPILAKYSKIPEDVIAQMRRVRYATSLDVSNLQPSIDVMAKYGFITQRMDANAIITRV